MKKRIIIMSLLVSSLAFANGENFLKKNNGGNQGQFKNLTEEEQIKFDEMRKEMEKEVAPLVLDVKEVNISLQREMIKETIDWKAVEKLLNEKSIKEAKVELEILKNRKEHKDEFEMIGIGRGIFNQNMNMNKGNMNKDIMNKGKERNLNNKGNSKKDFNSNNKNQFQNMSDEEQAKLIEKIEKDIAPLRLDVRSINISIEKELLEDKVNWKNVEKSLKEKTSKEAEIELVMLKNRKEHKGEFMFKRGNSNNFKNRKKSNNKKVGNKRG